MNKWKQARFFGIDDALKFVNGVEVEVLSLVPEGSGYVVIYQEKPYKLGTEVPGYGKIEAVRGNAKGRDYLLQGIDGSTTWLDHAAIGALISGEAAS